MNMASFGSNLYLLLTNEDPPTHINDRKFNLDLYEIRQESGHVNRRVRMGSLGVQDRGLDMRVNFKGIYILAEIGSFICIEGTCSVNNNVWDTKFHLTASIAIILLRLGPANIQIVEIEVSSYKAKNYSRKVLVQSRANSGFCLKGFFFPEIHSEQF